MIYSMTGFGAGRSESSIVAVSVEAKTVNHRYLDVHIRLPSEFQSLEAIVRKVVTSNLRRGRVDLFVKIDVKCARVSMELNSDLISSFLDLTRQIQEKFSIDSDVNMEAISRIPGAITVSNENLGAEDLESIERHLEEATIAALAQVKDMRRKEGESLFKDLSERINKIDNDLKIVESVAESLVEHHREVLYARVEEVAPDVKVDSNRLEIEVLMQSEKSNIAEEITRIASHLKQFKALKLREEESGKRMDFLLQEMNREVNTVLSKTSGLNQIGTRVGEAAIDIKVEIEKLREQVQNIE